MSTFTKVNFVLYAVFAGVVIYFMYHVKLPQRPELNGSLVPDPKPLPEMTFEYQGQQQTLGSFKGKWLIVYFGFLTCPDICSVSLAALAKEYEQIEVKNRPVQVLFVSVDTDRDLGRDVDAYAKGFHPEFMGIAPDPENLKILAKGLGAFYNKRYLDDPDIKYLMDHSAEFFLIDPERRWHSYFRSPQPKGAVAQDLSRLLKTKA
jgi:protein SCO1